MIYFCISANWFFCLEIWDLAEYLTKERKIIKDLYIEMDTQAKPVEEEKKQEVELLKETITE